MYKTVNDMLGDLVKVTPSSKVVGDLAIFMVQNDLTPENIEDGKTLVIKYLGLGDANEDGTRNVMFELNGSRREVAVKDPFATEHTRRAVLTDENDPRQIGASIPGMVSAVKVKPGDTVEENQVLAVIEAMKMETSITAHAAGVIKEIRVEPGQAVKAKELLFIME